MVKIRQIEGLEFSNQASRQGKKVKPVSPTEKVSDEYHPKTPGQRVLEVKELLRIIREQLLNQNVRNWDQSMKRKKDLEAMLKEPEDSK